MHSFVVTCNRDRSKNIHPFVFRPLPNTAPAGPVSPCPLRSKNPTLSNRTETRSSSVNGRDSRRKHGEVFATPSCNTPSGPSCGKWPDGGYGSGCSIVCSDLRSSIRTDCCKNEFRDRSERPRNEVPRRTGWLGFPVGLRVDDARVSSNAACNREGKGPSRRWFSFKDSAAVRRTFPAAGSRSGGSDASASCIANAGAPWTPDNSRDNSVA